MRNAGRWLPLAIGATLVSGAVTGAAGWINATSQSEGVAAIVLGIGLVVTLVIGIFALIIWKVTRAVRKARRPDQRVAGWTVNPETWAAFLAIDAERAAEVPTHLRVFKASGTGGPVEVLAARGGILMDGLFVGMEPRGIGAMYGIGWLARRPECIEVGLYIPRSSSGGGIRSDPALFRVPVEPAQREGAVAAFEYYRTLLERGQLSDPAGHRLMVRIAFWLGAALLAVGLVATFGFERDGAALPVVLAAVIGIAGGLGALFVAGVVWLVMLKRR